MPSSFKRAAGDGKTTAADTAITVRTTASGAQDVGIGLMLTNVTTQDDNPTSILVKAWIALSGGGTIYIADGWPIPAGGSVEAIEGKTVLEDGDVLKVQSDTANSLDALFSFMEQT